MAQRWSQSQRRSEAGDASYFLSIYIYIASKNKPVLCTTQLVGKNRPSQLHSQLINDAAISHLAVPLACLLLLTYFSWLLLLPTANHAIYIGIATYWLVLAASSILDTSYIRIQPVVSRGIARVSIWLSGCCLLRQVRGGEEYKYKSAMSIYSIQLRLQLHYQYYIHMALMHPSGLTDSATA